MPSSPCPVVAAPWKNCWKSSLEATRLYLNPIVILNVKNYFDPLLDMLRQAVDENFMRVQHGAIWHVAQTPQEAVELIYTTPLWDASIRKFAAI